MKKKNIAIAVTLIILAAALVSFAAGIYKFFTLENKVWFHYGAIAYTILSLIMVVWVALICYKKRGTDKWPWLFLILLGVGGISINLGTGAVSFDFAFQFPYISFKMGLRESSYLSLALPLGAVLYMLYHSEDLFKS